MILSETLAELKEMKRGMTEKNVDKEFFSLKATERRRIISSLLMKCKISQVIINLTKVTSLLTWHIYTAAEIRKQLTEKSCKF